MPFGLVLRRSILLGAPLALAVLMLFCFWPYDYYSNELMPIAGWWTVLRTIQFVMFAFMGASVWLLTDGLRGVEVFISRLGAVVFATFYNADDAVAVISTGLLARAAADAPRVERDAYIESIGTRFADPTKNLFFAVGSYAWIFALVAAAFALYQAGAPRLPLLLFAPIGRYRQNHRLDTPEGGVFPRTASLQVFRIYPPYCQALGRHRTLRCAPPRMGYVRAGLREQRHIVVSTCQPRAIV